MPSARGKPRVWMQTEQPPSHKGTWSILYCQHRDLSSESWRFVHGGVGPMSPTPSPGPPTKRSHQPRLQFLNIQPCSQPLPIILGDKRPRGQLPPPPVIPPLHPNPRPFCRSGQIQLSVQGSRCTGAQTEPGSPGDGWGSEGAIPALSGVYSPKKPSESRDLCEGKE